MTELRTAALRALASLKGYRRELGCQQPCDAERALEAALAYREDIAQAAFERWLVEKLLTVTQAQMAHADATCKQDLQVEPVAWRTFDGEGGYEYRTYEDNENYLDKWNKRNPDYPGWVEPLYITPPPCPTCEALVRTVIMDQTGRD
jgi:hypothetical protein